MPAIDKLINTQQLSEMLQIQPSTINKARVMRTGIPFVKINRSVRYKLSDIQDYLDSNRVDTASAKESE
jgi:Helix-turn-helix domain